MKAKSKPHLKEYTLTLSFPSGPITAKKTFDSRYDDRDAKKWMQICLDICGKDHLGRRYTQAVLTSSEIPITQIVKVLP